MKHAMGDLETWGTAPGSALRSIGVVIFDPGSTVQGATFYRNIDFASQEAIGLVKDPRTEAWWAEQTIEAQLALSEQQVPIQQALTDLARWWVAESAEYLWGHGANFDPVLLDLAPGAPMTAADAAAFAPRLPEAIRRDIARLWNDATKDGFGLLGPNLQVLFSAHGHDASMATLLAAVIITAQAAAAPISPASTIFRACCSAGELR